MARKNRKVAGEAYTVVGSKGAELLGLEEPFPAAPYRSGNHCLYINKSEARIVVIFAATYAAKKYLELLIGGEAIKKTRGITGQEDTIISESGILIRCETIDEILSYKLNEAEERWQLGEPDTTNALNFKHGAHERGPDSEKVVAYKREKVKREPKPSKDGLTTIGQIAEELKIHPRDARAILRKKKIQKPSFGWAWDKNEVDKIKQIIHDNK